MAAYTKAISAFLTGLVGILMQFGINTEFMTPEMIAGVTTLLSTAAVYWFANRV